MIRLVVTADDVGLAPGLTRGALHAHEHGVVTAASVAAVGEHFAAAAQELRRAPELDVGIHLVLTAERPLSPASEIPSLVGGDGRFLPGLGALLRRAWLGGLRRRELALELGRQVGRLREHGLVPLHADGHQHLHVLPAVWPVVLALVTEHGIPFVRIPHEPAPGLRSPRGLGLRALNRHGRRARATLPRGVRTTDVTLGLRHAGHLSAARLDAALATVPRGAASAELVCHPGLGGELGERYRWGYAWEEETAALCAPGLRVRLAERGLVPCSLRELLGAVAG